MNAAAPRASRFTARAWPQDLACCGLLLALVLLFQRDLLDPRTVYSSYDFARDVYPSFHWLHEHYRNGRGVFWDQSGGLGRPLFDLGASAYLYLPLRFLVTYFDAVPAVALCMVLHYFMFALGAYVLARSRAVSPAAAFVAAVATAFCGGMVDCASSFGLVMPLAWFPWMIFGLLLIQDAAGAGPARAVRAWSGTAVLGLSTGLAFLSGHIGMSLCQIYALAVLHLVHCLGGPGRFRRLKRSVPALAGAALIAGLLFGGQAMGLARVAAQAGRGTAYTETDAAAGAMNPLTLGQVFLPHLLGRLKDATFLGQSWRFGTNDPQGVALYMGVAAFVLVLFFLVSSPRREILPWAAAWLFLVFYALGNWTPLFRLFYYHLPVLGHLHWAVRAACQCAPLLCVPIALGLDRLQEHPKAWPGRLAVGIGIALSALALGLRLADPWLQALGRRYVLGHIVGQALHAYPAAFYLDKLSRWLDGMREHVAAQGLWALATGLVLVLLARTRALSRRQPWLVLGLGLLLFAELNANLADYQPTLPRALLTAVPPSARKILDLEGPAPLPFRSLEWGLGAQIRRSFPKGRFYGDLKGETDNNALLVPNLNKFYGLDMCNTYPDPDLKRLYPITGWFQDLHMDPPQPVTDLLARRRLYDLCGAKYFVLAEPLSAPGLKPLLSTPVYLYRNEEALPLAYVAGRTSDGWTAASAVAALCDPKAPQARWTRPALIEGKGPGAVQGGQGTVRWRDYSDQDWLLDVYSRGPGVLVLSRLYYPGPWKANVDGRPVELLAANGALCAVRLKAGRQRVRVYYNDPLPFRALALQGLGWALAAFCLLLALWVRPTYHR